MKLFDSNIHIVIAAFLSLFSLQVSATDIPTFHVETLTQDGVILKGVRYANPGRQPIVLMHGILTNTRSLKELGIELYKRGYDVFLYNFRGHGGGALFSIAAAESVRFDRIAAYDVDAIINSVSTETRSSHVRPIVLGYSLGGMALTAWLEGVDLNERGVASLSSFRAATRNGQISRAIFLAAPPHLSSLQGPIGMMSGSPRIGSLVMKARGPNLWTSFGKPTLEKVKHWGGISKTLAGGIETVIGAIGATDNKATHALRSAPVEWHRMSKFATKGLSEDRTGGLVVLLEKDFRRWRTTEPGWFSEFTKGELTSADFSVNYTRSHNLITTEAVVIAGDLDTMAPAKEVYEYGFKTLGTNPDRKMFVRFPDMNHLDPLIAIKSEKILADLIFSIDDYFEEDSRFPVLRLLPAKNCQTPLLYRDFP